MTDLLRPSLAVALIACSSARPAVPDTTGSGSDAGTTAACVSPLSRPVLPPLGQRRCATLPPGTSWDPAQPGPFVVGVTTLQLADRLRPGRMLTTEVWYPADDSARGQPGATYSIQISDIAAMLGVDLPIPGSIPVEQTAAVRDAPRAPHDPAAGLVVFSHGFRGVRYQSTFLTLALASYGYVVAAPDHQGNTMFDGSASPVQAAADRIQDMAFVTSEMIARTRSATDFFAGSFDPRRVGWAGHSFGASTVLMAGAFDNRELVGVSLAPAFDDRMTFVYEPASYDLRSALLVVGGTADTTEPVANQQLAYDRTGAPRYLAELDGAHHFDFTDVCANDVLRLIPQIGSLCGGNTLASQAATLTMTVAMMNRYLRCDPSAAIPQPGGVSTFNGDPGAAAQADPDPGALCDLTGPDAAAATDVTFDRAGGPPLHVAIRGPDDAPPLVFVHGFSMTGAVFQHQLDVLSRRYRVIVVDLRGHGASGADPSAPFGPDGQPGTADDPYDYTRFADDVDAVIDHFALARPIIIGWSSGGQVALEVARRGGVARLRGLVVVDATPLTIPDAVAHPMFNGGSTLPFARALQLALTSPVQDGSTWRPVAEILVAAGAPTALVDSLLSIMVGVPAATRLGQILAPRPDLVDALDAIAVPTLVVHGEQDDALLLESARYTAAHIPGAKLEIFQRSGHAPFLEEPERFDLVLDQFVQGLAP